MAFDLSIVIPTYNRLDRLRRVLGALERQTTPTPFEVVVVSDGSTDDTNTFLSETAHQLRIVPVIQPNQGVAAARNHGVRRASGRLVLFLDDDVVPAPELVARHLALHNSGDATLIVLGPMLTPADFKMAPWVRWEQDALDKQYQAMQRGDWEPTARQFYTGNTSLVRQQILEAGGFDERFRRAEDVELAYRLADRGMHFVFEPRAIGWHYAERSFASWISTPYAYGRNDVIFTRDKGQQWLLPTVLREFHERHRLVRAVVHLCLGRQLLSAAAIRALRGTALIAERLGVEPVGRMSYSGIFNLRYYQGAADELGGRDQFFRQLRLT